MSKASLFQSESIRTAVIGVIMTLVLALAMLLAMAFTHSHQNTPHRPLVTETPGITIDGHTFPIPQGWVTGNDIPISSTDAQRIPHINLIHPQRPNERMTLGMFAFLNPDSPASAIELIQQMLITTPSEKLQEIPFRQTSFVGRVVILRQQPTENTGHLPVIHHLVVYTQDAINYQFIHHLSPQQQPARAPASDTTRRSRPTQQPQSSSPSQNILPQLLNIARMSASPKLIDASEADLAQASLAPQKLTTSLASPSWRWTRDKQTADDYAITLLPLRSSTAFWSARIAGVSTPASEPELFDPQAVMLSLLLTERTSNQTFEPLDSFSLQGWRTASPTTAAAASTDTATSTDASPSPPIADAPSPKLVNEYWYVHQPILQPDAPLPPASQPHSRGVILVHLLAEPEALPAARATLARALREVRVQSWAAPSDAPPQKLWDTHILQGQQLVTRLSEDLPRHIDAGLQYELISLNNRHLGLMMHHTLVEKDLSKAQGQDRRLWINKNKRLLTDSQWTAAADGSAASYTMFAIEESSPHHITTRDAILRYEKRSNHLRLYINPHLNADASPRVDRPARLNELPWIFPDRIPPQALRQFAASPNAMVWQMDELGDLLPCWVVVRPLSGQSGQNLAWRINIHSAACLTGDVLWYDAQGRLVGRQTSNHLNYDTLPYVTRYTSISRTQLLQRFPEHSADIMSWEKQFSSHDQDD